MNVENNVVDPYVGQLPEGQTRKFESIDMIETWQLKVFLFDSPEQLIITKTPEFTAVCPFSGQPDIAEVEIQYYPIGGKCLELKALKYYLNSFRNVGIYQENVTRRIHRDLWMVLDMPDKD